MLKFDEFLFFFFRLSSILKVPLWLKNGDETDRMSQEQFVENDLDMVDGGIERCVDSRNETLIKHFDRNFNRSKSNIEFSKQNDIVVVTNNEEDRNGSSSPVFDRGIADGGSNQPDSDFGEFYFCPCRNTLFKEKLFF